MTLKPKAKAGKVRNVLSESEDEDGVNAGGSGGVALAHPATGSDSMLGELTKIVKLLTDDKMRKARVSKVEAALEGISSSGVTDGSLGTGKKSCCCPSCSSQCFARISGGDIRTVGKAHVRRSESPDRKRLVSQVLFFVPEPGWNIEAEWEPTKTSAYAAWSAAGILDSLISGNVAAARARAGFVCS